MDIQWRSSPNYSSAARRRGDVRGIVLHDTESSLESALNAFAVPNGVSAHYVIALDGTIYQCVRDEDVAYHVAAFGANPRLNRNRPTWLRWPEDYNGRYSAVNAVTIGIELAGFASEGYTPEQYRSLGELVRALCQRWGLLPILLPDAGAGATIVTHGWLQTDRTDPGPRFDWEALRAALGAAPVPPPPEEEDEMAQLTDDQRRILERMEALHANADSIVEWINTIGALQQINADLEAQLRQALAERNDGRQIVSVTVRRADGSEQTITWPDR